MLQVFRRHTSRVKQFWGVKSNEEPVVQVNPDWEHDRTGFSSMFVNLLAMIYAPQWPRFHKSCAPLNAFVLGVG